MDAEPVVSTEPQRQDLLAAVTKERDDLQAKLDALLAVRLKGVGQAPEGGVRIDLQSEFLPLLAHQMYELFQASGGTNYVEWTITHREAGPLVMTMQRQQGMTPGQRVSRLEAAIRAHRDQRADDRCIEDDDRLYEALGDGVKCDRRVGDKAEMLRNCERFIDRRCVGGHWPSYRDLEAANARLVSLLEEYGKHAADSGWHNLAGEIRRRTKEASQT